MPYYKDPSNKVHFLDDPQHMFLLPPGSVEITEQEATELLPQPEPTPVQQYQTQFSVLDFRDRFTIPEQIAIRQAQLTDMEVGLVYDAFISAQFIDVTDPRVDQGIDLYISKGLIDPSRKAPLLESELIG